MAYLTYEEYSTRGGKVDSTAFALIERHAEIHLDYYTQNRLRNADTIPEEVKDLMTKYVDILYERADSSIDNILSYSNGVESFHFNEKVNATTSMYDLAVMYLPVELISCAVD